MSSAQQPSCRFADTKIDKIRYCSAAACAPGAEDGRCPGRLSMTTALLAIAPRISYRVFLVAFFIAAYPLWHADFPAVWVEHVDIVPLAPQSTAMPVPESVPAL